ncbi:hypothetical protein [Streptomyces sp. TLI_105]|uniref:hypothetical protein n=1 Tax=Streptomyces sp. TLI_105 TaxID=1881019 RepID=UPI000897B046|nr:hypothetical protein [Streptomyces sp. TLI_105]SEE60002.1 hypothetical protein SAMN05428939_8073 [Streptomyces sp. TLI_105]
MSTSSAEDISRRVGEAFGFDQGMVFEDLQLTRLHYHLLRLTTAGLSEGDVAELRELARLAFENSNVDAQCDRIRDRDGASAVAVTIASIVRGGGIGDTPRGQVMLGAVLGAYASMLDTLDRDRSTMAVLGAIGGGLAASAMPVIQERIDVVGLAEYLSKAE